MSIAVSVLTTSRVARNSGGAARQENRPASAGLMTRAINGRKKNTIKELDITENQI
jgi:hypothetical protein